MLDPCLHQWMQAHQSSPNSSKKIYAWNVKTKDGLVKWCPSRLVVVASSVECNNLIPDQAWTNKQGQTKGHTVASNSSGKGILLDLVQSQKEHHSMTKSPSFLSPSLPTPHPNLPPSSPSIPPPPPSLSPWVHTEHLAALAPPSDITRWLKLLAALECG